MNIQTNYLEVKKTARYVTYGNLSEKTQYFWLAVHGSNMLCEQMIYKFKEFDPETHFVVAPEALSRFYAKKFGGDVLAAWMTSRDRLKEIDDLAAYLNQLYTLYTKQLSADCKKTILSFSQGGTITYRWLHRLSVEADYLLAYSCWIPEDIDLKLSVTNLNELTTIYTYGIQDQFLTEKRIKVVQEIIQRNDLKIKMEAYEGDHRVSKVQLKAIFEKYIC